MNVPLKVVFFGNHTVGVRTLEVLARDARLVGVVAHPPDPEDGVRYESVGDFTRTLGVPLCRGTGRSAEVARFIADLAPDLMWITDYRYLLPTELVRSSRLGAVNLHPSLLPRYRGRASINWAILRGETELGLSAHWVDSGMDTGNIIAQRRYSLSQHEDVGDALEKLYPLYASLTSEVLALLAHGKPAGVPQDHAAATEFLRRRPEDGAIDWQRPARDVWNLIRAVAAPYPGAFAAVAGAQMRIWRAADIRSFPSGTAPRPGELLAVSDDARSLTIACADAALEICRYDVEVGQLDLAPVQAALPTGAVHCP